MTDERARVDHAWQITQASLPEGWTLEGQRCASTGLSEADRSDDQIAVAAGPMARSAA